MLPTQPEPAPPPTEGSSASCVPRRRDVVVLAVGLVLVVGLALTLVVLARDDDRPRVEAGTVLLGVEPDRPDEDEDEGDGRDGGDEDGPSPARVNLPWTALDVMLGEPVAELPAPDDGGVESGSGAAAVRAPEGGSFVPVRVELVRDAPVAFVVADSPYVGEAEVVLRADGRDYPMADGFGGSLDADAQRYAVTAGQTRWVAVAGDPQDVELLVTVGDVTQAVGADGTVDAGRAAVLADLPSNEQLVDGPDVRCRGEEQTDRSGLRVDYPRRMPCRVQLALRTPYVDGLGWAPEGREYVAVHVVVAPIVLSLRRPGAPREPWDEGRIATSATLDGSAPLAQADVNALNTGLFAISDSDDPEQLVFEVDEGAPPGDLVLELEVPAVLGAPFVTDRRSVSFRWSVAAEELL